MKKTSLRTSTGAKPHKRRTPPRKNAIVLAAAEQSFIELGYTGASIDAIAERAGVSKRTVYSNFATKEVLYGEVVKKICREVVPTEIDPRTMDADPEQTLYKVSLAFLEALYDPRQVAFYQTVVADSRQMPEAGKMVFEGPIARTQAVFEHFFRAQAQRGTMEFPNLDLAAAQFVAILKTNLHVCLMLSHPADVSRDALQEVVRASIHVFLYGTLKRSKSGVRKSTR